MKKYKLHVLIGYGLVKKYEVLAHTYRTETSVSVSSNHYSFFIEEGNRRKFVSSFPIDRTIIVEVTQADDL